MTERIKNEAGYSLVEVMVAIMLLGLAIIPMVSMFDAGLRAAVLGGNYDQARAIASEQLEEADALPFNNPDPAANSIEEIYPPGTRPCTPPIDSRYSCEVRTVYTSLGPVNVEELPGATSGAMMKLTVTVSWTGGGSYNATGLVSKQ